MPDTKQKPRYVLALLACVACCAFMLWNQGRDVSAQMRFMGSAAAFLLTLAFLFVWSQSFGRLPRMVRRGLFWGTVGAALAAFALLEVRGVSGDLVPVIGWRFGPARSVVAPEDIDPAFTSVAAKWRSYPQFLGADRTASIRDLELVRDWDAQPPRELWRIPVGEGWSAFAVEGRDAITQEQRDDDETVVCYDLASGMERWVHADERLHTTVLGGVGPRATPSIAGERVVAVGALGNMVCLDRATGELVWEHDLLKAHAGSVAEWGYSSSPLVVGDHVFATTTGSSTPLICIDLATGTVVWTATGAAGGYSSPHPARLLGQDQVLVFGTAALTSYRQEDGAQLWSFPWQHGNPSVAQPVVISDDSVLVSGGYSIGALRVQLTRDDDGAIVAEGAWKSRSLKSKFANILRAGDYVYGLDDGILACLDLERGRRQWKDGRYGHGQLALIGSVILVVTESGDLVIGQALPDEWLELASVPALAGKTWNCPTIAAPYLLVRNDVEAVCYELAFEASDG